MFGKSQQVEVHNLGNRCGIHSVNISGGRGVIFKGIKEATSGHVLWVIQTTSPTEDD